MGVYFAIIVLAVVLFVSAVVAWFYRGLLMSLTIRLLASSLPNAAKDNGLSIRFGAHQDGWIRLTLQANLGKTLSQVVGRPVEAAAYSHFGGFNLNHVYSDFMNPDSVYYQAWLGAYVVFDDEERQAFGFDEQGGLIPEEALAVLEADQRLVYHSAGCPHKFADGNVVRLTSAPVRDQQEVDGQSWWRISGEAETRSVYHRGKSERSSFRRGVYGVVPSSADHDVDDFHPLRYQGEFWVRYFPEFEATCAKFYIYPYYKDKHGKEVIKGEGIVAECQELLASITFSKHQ
jgi:hypothetical protein